MLATSKDMGHNQRVLYRRKQQTNGGGNYSSMVTQLEKRMKWPDEWQRSQQGQDKPDATVAAGCNSSSRFQHRREPTVADGITSRRKGYARHAPQHHRHPHFGHLRVLVLDGFRDIHMRTSSRHLTKLGLCKPGVIDGSSVPYNHRCLYMLLGLSR